MKKDICELIYPLLRLQNDEKVRVVSRAKCRAAAQVLRNWDGQLILRKADEMHDKKGRIDTSVSEKLAPWPLAFPKGRPAFGKATGNSWFLMGITGYTVKLQQRYHFRSSIKVCFALTNENLRQV